LNRRVQRTHQRTAIRDIMQPGMTAASTEEMGKAVVAELDALAA
jgi:hypothetical protein